jgi:hypothetical protein
MLLAEACAATRRLLATHSIVFFAYWYLGLFLPWHQQQWIRRLLRAKRIVILAPRGHGKTEIVSKLLPLWLIVCNRNIRILMVTKSAELARRNSMLIRTELRTNQRIIGDFGDFYHHKQSVIWQQSTWMVVRDKVMKDPTFTAVGLFGAVTGNRCDILILDDVIDRTSVNTPEQIAKVDNEIKGTYFPLLEPSGQTFAIGTRKNYNDIYGTLLKSQGWTKIVQCAVLRFPDQWHIEELDEPVVDADGFERWDHIVIDGKDPGQMLWDARPMQWLLEQRLVMGSVLWEQEIQNNVVDEATALFPWRFLNQCKDESMSWVQGRITPRMRRQYVCIIDGTDPALVTSKQDAERRDSDNMVNVAIGLTRKGERHFLAIDVERGLSPAKVETRIMAFYKRTKPLRMLIERNSFGILHIHNLISGTDMRIVPHQTGLNKKDPYEGVGHLSPLFENLKFRIPYKTAEDKRITDALLEEFHGFGSDIHDDRVMASWIACYGILRYLGGQARIRKMKAKQLQGHIDEKEKVTSD